MKTNKKFIIILILLLIIGCNYQKEIISVPLETVPFVDIEQFMGKWYVIANIPTFFEKDATNAIEYYELNKNGSIETTFSFFKGSPIGKKMIYTPKGYIYNKKTNAEWRMEFLWPFKSPFLIIDIAEDYSYTVIGYPNRKYVWIMSRESNISEDIYLSILDKLKDVGYDISKIELVPQIW